MHQMNRSFHWVHGILCLAPRKGDTKAFGPKKVIFMIITAYKVVFVVNLGYNEV